MATKNLADKTAKSSVATTDKLPLVESGGATKVATFEDLMKSIDLTKVPTTTLADVTDDSYILTCNSSGTISKIPKASLASVVGGLTPIYDDVFIMYHRKSDNYPLMVKPKYWTSLQTSGEVADGVVVVEGGKCLVIAPTEPSDGTLYWSSAQVSGGGTTTTDRVTAIADWGGKASTTAQCNHSECSDAAYAPGFCHAYSRTNANGYGLTAGMWWLPSVGEMMMIYGRMDKINYALSLITGATQLQRNAYWTSTEASAAHAWHLHLSDGYLHTWYNKVTGKRRVRAVSAFIS